MTVTTYYLHESVVSPVSVGPSQLMASQAVAPREHFGHYETYRLTQFVNQQDSVRHKGEVIPLAVIRDDKVAINQRALDLINAYRGNDIAFVGNYGRANSGKSYWYDTVLALSEH